MQEDICDAHATCTYDESIGKSICKCDRGYQGSGQTCSPAPECEVNDHCGENSLCENGICSCMPGFERDLSDL